MSWLSRRGALSRLAQHLDHHLHDHHAASYYSLFRPTTFTSFHNSPAENLFRQFQPASLNRFFTFWDDPWQEGDKETNNNNNNNISNIKQQTNNSKESRDHHNSLQSTRSSSPRHHLHRYRSHHHHRQPFDALANFWSPFVSFPIPSIVPSITLNLYSTPTSYQIQAELPGVKKEEIVISVEKGTLTIEAEKKEERGNRPNTSSANNTNANAAANNDSNNSNNTVNIKSANAQTENTNSATSNDTSSSSSSSSTNSSPSSSSTSSSSSSAADSNNNDVEDLYVESHYGRVSRSVSLPDDAALDGLTAKYEDGVIKIEIPRRQIAKEEKKIVQLQ